MQLGQPAQQEMDDDALALYREHMEKEQLVEKSSKAQLAEALDFTGGSEEISHKCFGKTEVSCSEVGRS